MTKLNITLEEFFLFRSRMLKEGGSSVDFDWLSDLECGLSWSDLQKFYIDKDTKLKLDKSLEHLSSLWRKYLSEQIPLQYLIGRCPWRDFELEVNHSVLIPRPETELLVDLALERINRHSTGHWVDLGTGSGAIGVSLARDLPGWFGHMVDSSNDALSIASLNLMRLAPNSNCELHLGNWWEPIKAFWGQIDLALVNPPYIPDDCFLKLEAQVLKYEPHLALRGGLDGLTSIRLIINGAKKVLKERGVLIMEHHFDQSERVLELMKLSGLIDIHSAKDFEGIKRFAIAYNP